MDKKYNTEEYIKLKEKEKKELSERLSNGIKDALNSDRYKNFLKVMAKCHKGRSIKKCYILKKAGKNKILLFCYMVAKSYLL